MVFMSGKLPELHIVLKFKLINMTYLLMQPMHLEISQLNSFCQFSNDLTPKS
jgi:hypothetical protein